MKDTYDVSLDAWGNVLGVDTAKVEKWVVRESNVIVEAAFKTVVRGGKKVRLPLVRRKKRRRLTSKQRAGIRLASRTRNKPANKRARAKSLLIRKRLGLKPKGTPRGMRVG